MVGLVVTTVWVAKGFIGDNGYKRFSPGTVADVHAPWDGNCGACHIPFTSVRSGAGEKIGHASGASARCQTCHAGPPHHETQTEQPACATCHHEHRGAKASLVNLPDKDCTQCHSDLAGHTQGGRTSFQNTVHQFDSHRAHHPEFRSLAADPSALKFNHKLHLSPGMATPEKGDPKWTLDRLSISDQVRYRKWQPEGMKDPTDRIQLQCASCHVADSDDLGIEGMAGMSGAVLSRRGAGAYMQPIVYEAHCQACHPLNFERPGAEDPRPEPARVPHRLQPDGVRRYLEGYYTAELLKGNKKLFEEFVPFRPLPGKPLAEKAAHAWKLIESQVRGAERGLHLGMSGCRECHYYETAKDYVPVPVINLDALVTLRIRPSKVKDVWFEHAVFNHAAHRALNCRSCHARAYPDSTDKDGRANASMVHSDVLIAGIDNCLQCHSPAVIVAGERRGGARFDCTECHRYHHRDEPFRWQGIGAAARDPLLRLPLQDFLKGTPRHGPLPH